MTFALWDTLMLTCDLIHQGAKAGEVGIIIDVLHQGAFFEVDFGDHEAEVFPSQIRKVTPEDGSRVVSFDVE